MLQFSLGSHRSTVPGEQVSFSSFPMVLASHLGVASPLLPIGSLGKWMYRKDWRVLSDQVFIFAADDASVVSCPLCQRFSPLYLAILCHWIIVGGVSFSAAAVSLLKYQGIMIQVFRFQVWACIGPVRPGLYGLSLSNGPVPLIELSPLQLRPIYSVVVGSELALSWDVGQTILFNSKKSKNSKLFI